LRAVLAAALVLAVAPGALALEVSIVRTRLVPGESQEAVVSGLGRGVWFGAAWLDPTGRVRDAWSLRVGRRGVGRVRFRTRGAIPGTHRVVVWLPAAEGRAEARFEILPGEAPAYLTVVDAPGLERGRSEAVAHSIGARAVATSGPLGPTAPLGWMVRALEGGPSLLDLDEADVRARRTAYARSPADALLARPVCLRDRAWLIHVWKWAGPRAESAARARPWLWSLGRDVSLADDDGGLDFCRSPRCARAFIAELHRRHDDIASLNKRWGSTFRGWMDVRAATVNETVNALQGPGGDLSRAGPKLASWSDQREFMDLTWIGILRDSRELIRSVARRAPVGLGGVDFPGIFTGADPTRLLRELDWVDVRARPLDLALARSFASKRCRLLTRLGPDDSADVLIRGLANGHCGAVLLPGKAPERPNSEAPRTPGDGPLALGAWKKMPEILKAIEGGLGELFARSIWEPDPIVVLYSRESLRVEWAMRAAAGEPSRPGAALAAWAGIMSDIGLAARFVETSDLARVLKGYPRVRALVLPRAYVLGRHELAAINRFAVTGGLVVADASAGVFDENFRPRLAPEVESVFGISREAGVGSSAGKPDGELVFAGMHLPGAYIDGVDKSVIDLAEPNVRAVAAYVHARRGSAVGLLTNPYGRGRGVYLNLGLEGYPEERLSARGASMRRLVRNVLELGRVGPRVGVVVEGADLEGCERVVRRIEEMEIITLCRDAGFGGGKVAAELVFARPALCFDVLTGVLIGRGARVRVKLGTGSRVFARLPYDVEGITLKVSEREGVLRYHGIVETPIDLAGTHVIRRALLDSRGRPVPGGEATFIADRGVFKGSIQLAENEPPGDYRLVFRDVASGVEAELTITRSARPMAAEFPLSDK
jgi:hypothetical protein